MENTRFTIGLEQLAKIDGEAGQQVIDSLQDICPDLARFTIEYPFGDIYTRQALDLKSREIATVAALTALGHCKPQLKVHLNAALNVGCTEDEVKEILLQMSVYAGFPSALNGMFAFKEVLQERTELEVNKGR
jgi:4-carboxymuconolactone decarboxylase